VNDIKYCVEGISLKVGLADSTLVKNIKLNLKKIENEELNLKIYSSDGIAFIVKCLIDSKDSGVSATFYAENCLLNYADKDLKFFYDSKLITPFS